MKLIVTFYLCFYLMLSACNSSESDQNTDSPDDDVHSLDFCTLLPASQVAEVVPSVVDCSLFITSAGYFDVAGGSVTKQNTPLLSIISATYTSPAEALRAFENSKISMGCGKPTSTCEPIAGLGQSASYYKVKKNNLMLELVSGRYVITITSADEQKATLLAIAKKVVAVTP